MKRKALFTVVLIMIFSIAYSKTDKITGKILDGTTNRFLSNCSVTLLKNSEIFDTKYSNGKGEFAFYRVDTGSYILRIEKNEFLSEEYDVEIKETNNINHSFNIYLNSKNVVAEVNIIEYPQKSDLEYFLLNHQFKKYNNDSTALFSSTGECVWNSGHQLLYIGFLKTKLLKNGKIEIEENMLLGVYEVISDIQTVIAVEQKEDKNKWLSVIDKISQVADKVVKDNTVGIIMNGK